MESFQALVDAKNPDCRKLVAFISKNIPRDIVDQNNGMRSPVKTFDKRMKCFLPCCVPKLQFDIDITLDLYNFGVILNPQGDCILVHKLVGDVALDEATLSTSRVANYYYFEYQIVVLNRFIHKLQLNIVYKIIDQIYFPLCNSGSETFFVLAAERPELEFSFD